VKLRTLNKAPVVAWIRDGGSVYSAYFLSEGMGMDEGWLRDFAVRYTAAWCSQDAARVAEFFGEDGSLCINEGVPAVGRAAIAAAAQGFMTGFPHLRVMLDRVVTVGEGAEYAWTLTGTNSGPGGTGRAVRISGFERWRFGEDGLVAASVGTFDGEEWVSQVGG
jgi:uncharacterized protein (TIGR02246 family)